MKLVAEIIETQTRTIKVVVYAKDIFEAEARIIVGPLDERLKKEGVEVLDDVTSTKESYSFIDE